MSEKEETKEPEENLEVLRLEAVMGRFFMIREKCEQQIVEANNVINKTLDKIRKIKAPTKPEEPCS